MVDAHLTVIVRPDSPGKPRNSALASLTGGFAVDRAGAAPSACGLRAAFPDHRAVAAAVDLDGKLGQRSSRLLRLPIGKLMPPPRPTPPPRCRRR